MDSFNDLVHMTKEGMCGKREEKDYKPTGFIVRTVLFVCNIKPMHQSFTIYFLWKKHNIKTQIWWLQWKF